MQHNATGRSTSQPQNMLELFEKYSKPARRMLQTVSKCASKCRSTARLVSAVVHPWAAWYYTWLLIILTLKGVVFSFSYFSFWAVMQLLPVLVVIGELCSNAGDIGRSHTQGQ